MWKQYPSKGKALKASESMSKEVLEWCNRNWGGAKVSIVSFYH